MRIPRFSLSPRTRRFLLVGVVLIAIAYISTAALIWRAMNQPPEQFGRFMMKLPGPVPFLLFPFETLWMRARAGTLHLGDPAPDFALAKLDRSETVRLSAMNQTQPVVLIFGSYT